MLLSTSELLRSNAVYYPCFDPAYPKVDWRLDFRLLPLLFDYVVIPPSHLVQNPAALEAARQADKFFKAGIFVGSVRQRQQSVHEFYFDKCAEVEGLDVPEREDAFLAHADCYRTILKRDTASQSAAFRHGLLQALTASPLDREGEVLLGQLPSHGTHTVHRETLDAMIQEIQDPGTRERIEAARASAYFAAGAAGNCAFLYDPHALFSELPTTTAPRQAVRFLRAILQRAGFSDHDLLRMPLDKVVDLYHSFECRLFRNCLLSTIRNADGALDELVLGKELLAQRQKSRG